jgi:hypothetical protein
MKRGFAPLIFSIGLIVVMLILTGFILFLPQDQFYEKFQIHMTLEEACSENNLILEFSVPCDNDINLGFGISNLGSVNVANIDFEVRESEGYLSNTFSTGLIIDSSKTFFLDVNQISNVNQIIVKPSVELNNEVNLCPPRTYEVVSVYSSCEFNNDTEVPSPPGGMSGGTGGGSSGGSSGGDDGGENPPAVLCPEGIDRDLDGYGINCSLGDDCNDYQYEYDSSCYFILDPYDDWWAADFALVMDSENVIHNYYIRGALWVTDRTHGVTFGHETSSDVENWNWEGVALSATNVSGNWDDDNIWAPDIEYYDGKYYMFYTGVNMVDEDGVSNHRERNGIATSTDLYNWTRYPVNNCFNTTGDGCVYDCDLDWNGWGTKQNAWAHQCRDPEVYYDALTGNWYMFLTTSIFIDNTTLRSILDLSKSTDLINWTDIGPLNFSLGPKVESPAIWKENEYYYLFWTSHDSGRLHYAYSTSIEGNWSEPVILPESCISSIHPDCDGDRYMIANEFIVTPGHQLFAYISGNTRNINFEEFEIVQENNLHDIMFKPSDIEGCDVDLNPADYNPGESEICDLLDNNCDFNVDEDLDCECYLGEDCDDLNECTSDFCNLQFINGSSCDSFFLADETTCAGGICQGGVCISNCTDNDGDGYSDDGGDCGPIDCDDNASYNYPGGYEICDLLDNNCDFNVDEDLDCECYLNEDCDDINECTNDRCEHLQGDGASCDSANLMDGTICAGGTCQEGVCEENINPVDKKDLKFAVEIHPPQLSDAKEVMPIMFSEFLRSLFKIIFPVSILI